jgi:polysaccharide biosynthesis transport protein
MPETESNLTETLEPVLRILKKRWLPILGMASVIVLLTVGALSLIPNHYSSEATLLVVQQQVPERYVTPTTSTGIAEALQAMTQQVLSRTRLLAIIEEFHLYAKEQRRLAPEQIVEIMRRRIDINPLTSPERKDFSAFKIAFTAEDPHTAQEVTSRLTSLFIQENLRTREDQATNTASFLRSELETTKNKLAEQETRLRDFKMQHLGDLPEQQSGNLAILTGLQSQLQNTVSSLGRAQQQKVYLESLLNGYRSFSARGVALPTSAGGGRSASPLETARIELAKLESDRAELLGSYTPQHPEVLKVERAIEERHHLIDSLKAKAASKGDDEKTTTSATTSGDDDISSAQVKSQLEANRLEIENLLKDQRQFEAQIAEYQRRINSTPIREQQLAAVVRDYDLLKQSYADLLSKEQQSQLAASLEKQQEGQHFRVVDPPSLPVVPSKPKRMPISLGGAAAGLMIGFGIAFLLELKKNALHTESEAKKRLGVALVFEIPLLLTSAEKRSRFWKQAFELAAGSLLLLVICAAQYYVYRHQ